MRLAFAAALAAGPLAATAQEINQCDWRANAHALVEPWEQNTRTFANGEVRLALIDTVEPALGAFYLLVLSPPRDVLGERMCRTIGFGNGMGYPALDFQGLEAEYDPAVGLVFRLPGRRFDPERAATEAITVQVTLNQATGEIGVRHEPGGG